MNNELRTKNSFTLIELLVVISIIAILMAIMVPTLRKARGQGKDILCKSNLRQIGLAANLYAEEWDLYVPRGAAGNSRKAWYQLFMPFLAQKPVGNDYRTVKIYRCPSYPDRRQTVCYVVNGWTFDSSTDMVGHEIVTPSRLTACNRRAYTIYLADNEDGDWRPIITSAGDPGIDRCDVWTPGHLPTSNSQDTYRGRRIARARHRNGSHCLFLDWHVEWMPAEGITADSWKFRK